MYYDAFEALPEKPLAKEEVQPLGCRYDGSIMVFGKTMQVCFLFLASTVVVRQVLCRKHFYYNGDVCVRV